MGGKPVVVFPVGISRKIEKLRLLLKGRTRASDWKVFAKFA